MKKITKAAIAAAVGGALLLGGGGTFALWNATAPVTGGTITAGNLNVVADAGAPVWMLNDEVVAAENVAGLKIVPGDKISYSKVVNVTASGNSLVASLSLGAGSIVAATPASAQNTALAGYLSSHVTLSASGAAITGTAPTYTITPGNAPITASPVTVTATIQWPAGGAGVGNDAKLGSVSLADMNVVLTQTVATP